MKTTKIYVVRHGQSVYNRDKIVSGHVDPELTDKGKEQAAATKERLSHVEFDVVYSSDLQRAVSTAEIIFGEPVPAENQLFELRERDFGKFDGGPDDDLVKIRQDHQPTLDSLPHEDARFKYKYAPDIESDHEVAVRFLAALKSIAEANPGKTVLVGAHGGTLRSTLVGLNHGVLADYPPGSIPNAAAVELVYEDGDLRVTQYPI